MAVSDPMYDEIMERAAAKKEAKKERASNAPEKKLVVDRTANGMYFLRYAGGGPLPEVLRTIFTSRHKMTEAIVAHYGKDITAGE